MVKKIPLSPALDAIHSSTSEIVKTRLRKRKAISPTPAAVRSSLPTEASPMEIDVKPQVYQPIALAHLDELAKIWDNDKRTPSVPSRRAWALARNLKPEHVHRWWYRRKKVAKKARIAVPNGTYELPVGTPPIIERVKEEPDAPAPPKKMPKRSSTPDDSDPASTVLDSTHLSSDGFEALSSSETAVADCLFSKLDEGFSAYSSASRPPPALFLDLDMTYMYSESRTPISSPLPPSSPPGSASPVSHVSTYPTFAIAGQIASSSQRICNQGTNKLSRFTCPLCKSPASSSGILERNPPPQAPLISERIQHSLPRSQIWVPLVHCIQLITSKVQRNFSRKQNTRYRLL